MKKAATLLAAGLFFVLTAATAQEKAEVTFGNGSIIKEDRAVGKFDKIEVNGPFVVKLVTGDEGTVTIAADRNIISYITTEVKDNVLIISPQEGRLFKASRGNKMIIRVPMDKLTEISLIGSGSVVSSATLKNNIKITLDGSGSIDLNVSSGQAEAILLGSGNIKLKGVADNFKCKLIGSGSLKSSEFTAVDVEVTVSGSGSAEVSGSSRITGRITGSGNVAYTGEPKDKDLKTTGSGSFRIL